MMRILVATDAWHPQVNGVVRTLTKLADRHGEALAEIYAAGDVLVFPIRTDTFGLVLAAGAVLRRAAEQPRFVA